MLNKRIKKILIIKIKFSLSKTYTVFPKQVTIVSADNTMIKTYNVQLELISLDNSIFTNIPYSPSSTNFPVTISLNQSNAASFNSVWITYSTTFNVSFTVKLTFALYY